MYRHGYNDAVALMGPRIRRWATSPPPTLYRAGPCTRGIVYTAFCFFFFCFSDAASFVSSLHLRSFFFWLV